ncbi:MAG: cytochrome b/b6 domain-containing protein [Candidatus Hermodarchaeota archaeon]
MKEKEETLQNTYKKLGVKPLNRKKVVNYLFDVIQLLTFLAVLITGLIIFPNLLAFFGVDPTSLPTYELILVHIWIGLLIGVLAFVHIVLHWRWIVKMTKIVINRIKTKQLSRMTTRNIRKYFLNWGLAVSSVITFVTGVIKFPGFLQLLGTNSTSIPMYELSFIHDWVGLASGAFIVLHLALNWHWIVSKTQTLLIRLKSDKTLIRTVAPLTIGLVVILGLMIIPFLQQMIKTPGISPEDSWSSEASIEISNIGTFIFNPNEVNTIRPDIFNEGYFSIFDILVHLDNNGFINMQYYFDENMNTHVIESINDLVLLEGEWWYHAYYDGGWLENNAFRMDHYPYKDQMFLYVFTGSLNLEELYTVFREEVERKEQNEGKIIIPTVTIRGQQETLTFNNVEVTAHNLRNDILQEGVITAIDVIMSLGDQGKITYDIQWYETVGTAEVGNFFVVQINDDVAFNRCGFVYEEGSLKYKDNGNHIHIPSDIRVINSPEYEEWFWICI